MNSAETKLVYKGVEILNQLEMGVRKKHTETKKRLTDLRQKLKDRADKERPDVLEDFNWVDEIVRNINLYG